MKTISMKNMINLLFTILCGVVYGQQEPQFTQFNDNMLYFNPAYAGSKDALNVTAMHRDQWVGFNGRPITSTVSLNTPLSYKSLGFGLTMINDRTGIINQNMAYADISYTIKFNNKAKLAFGIKGGVNYLSVGSNFNVSTPNDPNLNQDLITRLNPNFGFGMYYYTSKFFCGISVPKLIENTFSGSTINTEVKHYFANVGGLFNVNKTWKIRAIAQAKAAVGAPLGIDLSVTGINNDKFLLGAMYRLGIDGGIFAQFQLGNQLRVGLAYDFAVNGLRKFHNGSFEVMLSYDIIFKKEGVRSPRYF